MPKIGEIAGSPKKSGIHIKPSHKGLLHKKLGVPAGQKISPKKLAAAGARAKKTGNTALAKEVGFAKAAKKWKH